MSALILVVEDNPLNSELLCRWLEMEGHEVLAVEDLEGAYQNAQARPPALVLLDVGLGGEDGLSLIKWMRTQAALWAIPVIAVSAHAMIADQQRMLAAGCSAFITKPVDFERLREEIQRWLPLRADLQRQPRVLIVENDPQSLELLRVALEPRRIQTLPLSDGLVAAGLLERERFDGVFLDLVMPDLHGFEVIRSIRCSRLNARIPMVIVSSQVEQRAMQDVFSAGGTFFLRRPLELNRLNHLLNTTLGAVFQQR